MTADHVNIPQEKVSGLMWEAFLAGWKSAWEFPPTVADRDAAEWISDRYNTWLATQRRKR